MLDLYEIKTKLNQMSSRLKLLGDSLWLTSKRKSNSSFRKSNFRRKLLER